MKIAHWRWLRRVVQAFALALALLLILWTARDAAGPIGADVLLYLDPLAGLAVSLSARRWLPPLAGGLILLALTLGLGRFWCGWLCPLGTLIDWTRPRKPRGSPSRRWHRVKYGVLFLVLFSALLGSLTLLVLDPLTLWVRSVGVGLVPMAHWAISRLQIALYRYAWLAPLSDILGDALRPLILSYKQPFLQGGLAIVGLLAGILGLNLLAPRAWCRWLCPLGGLLSLAARASLLKRRVGEACVACGACARDCRMGAIDAARAYASDSGECTLCLDCAVECPAQAISFGLVRRYDRGFAYDPTRRQVLGSLGISLAGVALMNILPEQQAPYPYRLRPPGASEETLLRTCLRCGACLRACPTHGLQPSTHEAGALGLWTPILVPRLGHCEYSCNACGAACPTGAIPPLPLPQKQQTPIGKAYIRQDLCLAWTGRAPCLVCEEMCPLPEKAITVEILEIEKEGTLHTLQAPVVVYERCIGCGLCENRCPVKGEAAIRVRIDPLA